MGHKFSTIKKRLTFWELPAGSKTTNAPDGGATSSSKAQQYRREKLPEYLSELAVAIIEEMRMHVEEGDDSGNARLSISKARKAELCELAAKISAILTHSPLGIGVGSAIAQDFFKVLKDGFLLDETVNLLVLDVVMVFEILERVDPTYHRNRGVAPPTADAAAARGGDANAAPGTQRAPPATDGRAQAADGSAHQLVSPEVIALLVKKVGRIHVALLQLALTGAMKLCYKFHARPASCLRTVLTTVLASSKLAEVEAAARLLAKARDNFCMAVITSKAFGEYAAESLAQLRAEQQGDYKLRRGTIVLYSSFGKTKRFIVNEELDKAVREMDSRGGSTGGGLRALLAEYRQCQAYKEGPKSELCSIAAKQIYTCTVAGGERQQQDPVVLCVCGVHGSYLSRNGFLESGTRADTQSAVVALKYAEERRPR